jgi:hypothetical protein
VRQPAVAGDQRLDRRKRAKLIEAHGAGRSHDIQLNPVADGFRRHGTIGKFDPEIGDVRSPGQEHRLIPARNGAAFVFSRRTR